VATRVFFITVKTEPKTTPLRLFLRGQPPQVARAVGRGNAHRWRWERARLRGCGERWAWRRSREKTTRGWTSWSRCRPVALHQFNLARQAHRRRERLWVVDADRVVQRWKQTAGVQLDALGLIKPPCAKEESLEAV
jgi:hypothetical protein